MGQIGPEGKALSKFVHRGSYDNMDNTYEAITNHLDEKKKLEAKDTFIEEYITDPLKTGGGQAGDQRLRAAEMTAMAHRISFATAIGLVAWLAGALQLAAGARRPRFSVNGEATVFRYAPRPGANRRRRYPRRRRPRREASDANNAAMGKVCCWRLEKAAGIEEGKGLYQTSRLVACSRQYAPNPPQAPRRSPVFLSRQQPGLNQAAVTSPRSPM